MAFTGKLGTSDSALGNLKIGDGADTGIAVRETFTANSVLLGTLNITFSGNSILRIEQARTFTADAYFASTPVAPVLIFEDNFNRTTSAGDLGTPSGGIQERVIDFTPTPAEYYVNGSQLIVPESALGDAEVWFQIAHAAPEYEALFDFYTSPNSFYQFNGPAGYNPAEPSANKYYRNRAGVGNIDGLGVQWDVTSGFGEIQTVTLTANTMYRMKVQVLGQYVKIKVWLPADPEPGTWLTMGYTPSTSPFSDLFSRASLLVSWENTPHDEARVDNLQIYRLGVDTRGFFTADAVLASTTTTTVAFTADAFLEAAYNFRIITQFTASAILKKTVSSTFTANARIVDRISANFTANSVIKQLLDHTFTANSVIRRPLADPGTTTFSKKITLQVIRRRDRALAAYIPPRNPDEAETDDEIYDPRSGCLPPCPPVGGGPGGLYGANGTAIRRTIAYCANCSGNFFWTDDNKLGKGNSSSTSHPCCTSAHSGSDHTHRMWVQYQTVPAGVFQMRAKALWLGTAPFVTVKVFANAQMPTLNEGDCMAYDPDWWLSHWQGGDHIGNLVFNRTDSLTILGVQFNWGQEASALTIDGNSLNNTVFKFAALDEANYSGVQFKAANMEVTVGE